MKARRGFESFATVQSLRISPQRIKLGPLHNRLKAAKAAMGERLNPREHGLSLR